MSTEPRRYGSWTGNEKGVAENPANCIQEVWPKRGSWIPYQCRKERGFGEDGLYCRQHAKKHPAKEKAT